MRNLNKDKEKDKNSGIVLSMAPCKILWKGGAACCLRWPLAVSVGGERGLVWPWLWPLLKRV